MKWQDVWACVGVGMRMCVCLPSLLKVLAYVGVHLWNF